MKTKQKSPKHSITDTSFERYTEVAAMGVQPAETATQPELQQLPLAPELLFFGNSSNALCIAKYIVVR